MADLDRIYLDHNATTPLDPTSGGMAGILRDGFGNPSSPPLVRAAGARRRRRRHGGRWRALIGASPSEIVFTASGTEADNMALRGGRMASGQRRKIVYSAIEHHAIVNTRRPSPRRDGRSRPCGSGLEGLVDLDDLRARVATTRPSLRSCSPTTRRA
jgi:cysteine desulfurase